MEQPLHRLRTQMSGNVAELAPRRVGSTALVGAIEVAIVALLVYGMSPASVEKKLQDITTTVEDKVQVKTPPPPTPDTAKPPPPFIAPPDFQIATETPNSGAILSQSVRPTQAPPPQPPPLVPPVEKPTGAELIPSTKTTPTYPAISIRLGEEGTVRLTVTVGADGIPTNVVVAASSGKPRLDTAAVDWVKAHYRWKPCTRNGKPIECLYPLNVKFDLKEVQ